MMVSLRRRKTPRNGSRRSGWEKSHHKQKVSQLKSTTACTRLTTTSQGQWVVTKASKRRCGDTIQTSQATRPKLISTGKTCRPRCQRIEPVAYQRLAKRWGPDKEEPRRFRTWGVFLHEKIMPLAS